MKALGEIKHVNSTRAKTSLLPTVRRMVQKDVCKHLLNDDYILEVSKASQDCRS